MAGTFEAIYRMALKTFKCLSDLLSLPSLCCKPAPVPSVRAFALGCWNEVMERWMG